MRSMSRSSDSSSRVGIEQRDHSQPSRGCQENDRFVSHTALRRGSGASRRGAIVRRGQAMTRRPLLLCLALTLLTTAAAGENPPAQTVVKAARLLDVKGGRYVEGVALRIEGEKIVEVGEAATIAAHAGQDALV